MSGTIRLGLIGCGGIALANHLPASAYCTDVKWTAVCDPDPGALERGVRATGAKVALNDYQELIARDDIDALIIAAPNVVHGPCAIAAAKSGKHVLCEKPLAMSVDEAIEMTQVAREANVRNMVAFTYRFVPAMRYMVSLVEQGFIGRPYNFRSRRMQDWGKRNLGWRQVKELAATGELGDMLSHRIDFAHLLAGPIDEVVADTSQFHDEREGAVSELEDWVGALVRFDSGASGVLESAKVATGQGEGGKSPDICEFVGEDGALVYELGAPNQVKVGHPGRARYDTQEVPREFLVYRDSPRDPRDGDPVQTFRFDQLYEFISAIRDERDTWPNFGDGVCAQAVMDAMLLSASSRQWEAVDYRIDACDPTTKRSGTTELSAS